MTLPLSVADHHFPYSSSAAMACTSFMDAAMAIAKPDESSGSSALRNAAWPRRYSDSLVSCSGGGVFRFSAPGPGRRKEICPREGDGGSGFTSRKTMPPDRLRGGDDASYLTAAKRGGESTSSLTAAKRPREEDEDDDRAGAAAGAEGARWTGGDSAM
jgi:hypothetical protein